MKCIYRLLTTLAVVFVANSLQAADIRGGQTSVALDTDTLMTAASLELSGVSSNVIAPGTLPDSVAFGINSRSSTNPTSFSYDPTDFLGTFSGTIEHTGSVLFNADTVEVGDFRIDFDAARASTTASGFFVESTTGIEAVLFDVSIPSTLSATSADLTIAADLLVSPEFGSFLVAQGLASADLTGADAGDALVKRVVPEPASWLCLAILLPFAIVGRKLF